MEKRQKNAHFQKTFSTLIIFPVIQSCRVWYHFVAKMYASQMLVFGSKILLGLFDISKKQKHSKHLI
jgi:hypothetical protein